MSCKSSLWWEKGVSFSCIGCGRCCRGKPGAIYVTAEETHRIMTFLGITSESMFQSKYMTHRWSHPSIVERKNGECIFHDAVTNKCLIYPVRPAQCALFPFWPSIFDSEGNWQSYSKECPGMGYGHFYDIWSIAELLSTSPFDDL